MTSHTGRAYLNSCLKVPIDPCNNCPAPIYNRPKMYFGRLSTTTAMSSNVTKLTGTQTKDTNMDLDSIWTNQEVRSLAQFYDSIPDYCDINHLPEDEFYSTLDSLKTTCREFKTKTLHPCRIDDRSNTSSTTSTTTLCTSSSTLKSKKSSKKKSKTGTKKKSNQPKELQNSKICTRGATITPCAINYKNSFIDQMRLKSYKEDFKDEIEELKKTLKEFELRRPTPAKCSQKKPKICLEESSKEKISAHKKLEHICVTRPTSRTTSRQAYLKKSYSFNDIHSIADSSNDDDFKQIDSRLKHKLTKAEMLMHKDRNKLSNYFMQNSKKERGKERCSSATAVPKIIVGSSSLGNNFSPNNSNDHKTITRSTKITDKLGIPLNVFGSNDQSKKDKKSEHSSPSPVYPVARPNLAATLRAKVSQKKLMELANNCTYHDEATPPIDWEVRKTPAWKSLALNESHKEIIALRLATRKAEQKLQQREYELNMELMRQRVKSAPLLLEGATYWGFNVGKLTHSCQQAGIKHACQHQKQRKQRRKIASERRSFKGDDILENRAESSACHNNKYHTLRTIYASSTQSCSRNSRRAGTQLKQPAQPESGDDLSTGDRAYL